MFEGQTDKTKKTPQRPQVIATDNTRPYTQQTASTPTKPPSLPVLIDISPIKMKDIDRCLDDSSLDSQEEHLSRETDRQKKAKVKKIVRFETKEENQP